MWVNNGKSKPILNGGNTLIRSLLLSGSLLAASILSAAQAVPLPSSPPTWDLFAGGTLQRGVGSTSTPNYYGWDTSVTERPYQSHPWIGGTVEASGSYRNSASTVLGASVKTDDGAYTVMGGPSVTFKLHRVQPFARVLLGGLFNRTSISVSSQNASTVVSKYFGTAFGGGVDFPVTQKFAIRGQADWLRDWTSNLEASNSIRASAGVVFRF
jgi:hypothetical protein